MLNPPFSLPVGGTPAVRALGFQSCPCASLQAVVAAAFAVPLAELRASGRGSAPVAFARQSAMYLAHVVFGLSYAEVGRTFQRDRTTAAHACRLVEERRDDPALDSLLGALEDVCARLPSPHISRGFLP